MSNSILLGVWSSSEESESLCRYSHLLSSYSYLIKWYNYNWGSFCRIGYDDLYRGVYLLRFIYSTSLPVLILLFPWILTLLFVLFPFSIIFALPIALSIQIYKSATNRSNLLLPEEYCMMMTKVISIHLCLDYRIADNGRLNSDSSLINNSRSIFIRHFYLSHSHLCCNTLSQILHWQSKSIDRWSSTMIIFHLSTVVDKLFCFLACFGLDDWKEMLRVRRLLNHGYRNPPFPLGFTRSKR